MITSKDTTENDQQQLVQIITQGLGVGNPAGTSLERIVQELKKMTLIMQASHTESQTLREQAQTYLTTQQTQTQQYVQQLSDQAVPDFYPFVTLPAGTHIQDLPDGNRLFILSDGTIVKTADNQRICIVRQGEITFATSEAGVIEIAPGCTLSLQSRFLNTTQEIVGVSGLPNGTHPISMGSQRYSVELEGSLRLDIDQRNRWITLVNPAGPIDVIGINRIEGLGESIFIQLLLSGAKGFQCETSGHKGVIDCDATIHLSLNTGRDLVIRFIDNASTENNSSNAAGACLQCLERLQ